MRILILGGTGGIGSAVCRQGAQKHTLVALARSPEKLPPGVTAIKGDPLDPAQVAAASAGCGAVISALGAQLKGDHTVIRKGAAALLQAPIERIIVVSAAMLYPGVITAIVRRFLRAPAEDVAAMEAQVVPSAKDWTIVRPPRLLDTPGKGGYRTATNGAPSASMAREDVARALLDIAAGHLFSRQIIGLGAP